MPDFPFEKLTVWQKGKEFVLDIYKATKDFPNEEKFGLTAQTRRAAISVASNLAEGSSRKSKKDQAHFTQIAYSSLMEVSCQLIISKDLEFLDKKSFESLYGKVHELSRMLNSLYNSQLK